MKLNKKGSILDLILALAVFGIIAFALIIVSKTGSDLATELESSSIATTAEVNATLAEAKHLSQNIDYIPVFVFFAFILVMLILAMILPTEPAFLVIFIVGIVSLIIAPIMSNAYEELIEDSLISGHVTSYFPMTKFIASNMPYITIGVVCFMGIILYGRWRRESY